MTDVAASALARIGEKARFHQPGRLVAAFVAVDGFQLSLRPFAMRSIYLFPAAMIALATAAVPAIAQDVPTDLRCVLVGNAFAAAEKDEQKKQFATQVAHFFYGRVDARVTPAQLKVQVMAVAKGLNPQMMAPTMNACVSRLQAKLAVMQGIGREMAAAAGIKPLAPSPAPKK